MVDLSRLWDKRYRLNNLYHIIDKYSNSIRFKMNAVQEEVYNDLHNRNLILKARQLGMSTFCVLYLLDEVIFERNTSAGIVSYSLPHAQHIFKNIVGHAIDNLPEAIKPLGILNKTAKEYKFNNGSDFRVDTSLRGGTTQLVLITEYGKTCARSPHKAEEIITGTLESVPAGGKVLIESTAEGTSGPFAEMCLGASARGNDDLTPMDYKLFFFPWYSQAEYRLEADTLIEPYINEYFEKLEESGLKFEHAQKAWYQKKYDVLGEKVHQEYPSTVQESFVSNSDAYYFAELLQQARLDDRILWHDLYDPLLPVYVAADIGVTDYTVLTYFQVHHGEIRVIDYYADTNKGVDHYVQHMLKDKPYTYHTIYLPHDAKRKDNIIVDNTYKRELERLIRHTGTRVVVLPRTDRNAGIANAQQLIKKCVFNEEKCKDYIEHLTKYRKRWSESVGRYLDEPLHDVHSDYADSYRYAMQAAAKVQATQGMSGAMDRHKQAVASRRRVI